MMTVIAFNDTLQYFGELGLHQDPHCHHPHSHHPQSIGQKWKRIFYSPVCSFSFINKVCPHPSSWNPGQKVKGDLSLWDFLIFLTGVDKTSRLKMRVFRKIHIRLWSHNEPPSPSSSPPSSSSSSPSSSELTRHWDNCPTKRERGSQFLGGERQMSASDKTSREV